MRVSFSMSRAGRATLVRLRANLRVALPPTLHSLCAPAANVLLGSQAGNILLTSCAVQRLQCVWKAN